MEDHNLITVFALGLLTLLEMWALWLGIDGTALAAVIAILGYAVGYKHKARVNRVFSRD